MRKLLYLALCFLLLSAAGYATEDEEEWHYYEPAVAPTVEILLPQASSSYDAGGKLNIHIKAPGADYIEATLVYQDAEQSLRSDSDELSGAFDTFQFTKGSVLTVTAGSYTEDGLLLATAQMDILSPREKLFNDMFALAYKNSKDSYYKHAPAQNDSDRGICKNFVMRLFDTFKDAYRMKEYPDLPLHMPKNKSKKDSAPYQYGIEWRYETAEEGSPFEIAAQYKYDDSLSKEENIENCRAVLHQVQRGDFFQMCGDYYYGNGPHSLLFMSDYDPETDLLHWTDSNMKGDSVDGVHWGYLQYDAVKEAEWFVEAISAKSTYKTRGCTIYRLRDDLFIQ